MTIIGLGTRPPGILSRAGQQQGFTLIEVCMSMVLLAVSVVLTIPSYQDMVQNRQSVSTVEPLDIFVYDAQHFSDGEKLIPSIDSNGVYAIDPASGSWVNTNNFLTGEMQSGKRDYKFDITMAEADKTQLCSPDSSHEVSGYDMC